jgi:hypothetical protein
METILAHFNIKPDNITSPLPSPKNLLPKTEDEEPFHGGVSLYQRAIGPLMYLMLSTRPDLAYAVGKLAQFSSNPSKTHSDMILHVFSYIANTPDHSLISQCQNHGNAISPEGFVNADYAGDSSDQKSTTSYSFYLSNATFSWSSKKESTIATSTMEAEYIALFYGSQQAAWLWNFYGQIGLTLKSPIQLYTDSQSALAVAKGEQTHTKSKHLDVKLHSIREQITTGQILVDYVESEKNYADTFMKSLSRSVFPARVEYLGLKSLEGILKEFSKEPSTYEDAQES